MDWIYFLSDGWTRSAYLSIAAVLAPMIVALIIIIFATLNWRKRFNNLTELTAYVLLWLMLALFVGISLVLTIRFLLPPDVIEWLSFVPFD